MNTGTLLGSSWIIPSQVCQLFQPFQPYPAAAGGNHPVALPAVPSTRTATLRCSAPGSSAHDLRCWFEALQEKLWGESWPSAFLAISIGKTTINHWVSDRSLNVLATHRAQQGDWVLNVLPSSA
jgi:hypothetical protein